jgi:SNF2 family DNA or RNA helicase
VSLGLDGTTFRLSCTEPFVVALGRLALSMPTSRAISNQVLEVDADAFLRQLQTLAQWPDDDVSWSDDARRLAEDSLRDARAAEEALHGDAHRTEVVIDDAWLPNLTDFQLRDLTKINGLQHGANFSVPGAGKTRVALASFAARKQAGSAERLLVVAPKSAFDSWRTEIYEAWPGSPPTLAVFDGAAIRGAEVLVVNYERLPNSRSQLAQWLRERPSMLILDEAHRMKLGAAGAYGAACLALGPLARHRMILTGTPAPNGPDDLRSLMGFVWPGLGQQVVTQAVGAASLKQASQRLTPFFARTTKDELGLPPVEPKLHPVDLPPLHEEIYRALVGQLSARASARPGDFEALGRILMYLIMAADTPALLATGASTRDALTFRVPPLSPPEGAPLLELMRDLPSYEMSPKYQEALAIVAQNAARGRKTLVWSTFIRSLNSLAAMFEAFQPALVHGGTDDRDAQILRFKNDPDCMVLLSNPATLGEGISLHHTCHDAIYVDRDFAAGRYLQSLDRIHRLGLAPGTTTNITMLAARGTIDEIIHARLKDKVAFMAGILDDPDIEVLADPDEEESVSGGMNAEDIRVLMGHLDAPPE